MCVAEEQQHVALRIDFVNALRAGRMPALFR